MNYKQLLLCIFLSLSAAVQGAEPVEHKKNTISTKEKVFAASSILITVGLLGLAYYFYKNPPQENRVASTLSTSIMNTMNTPAPQSDDGDGKPLGRLMTFIMSEINRIITQPSTSHKEALENHRFKVFITGCLAAWSASITCLACMPVYKSLTTK